MLIMFVHYFDNHHVDNHIFIVELLIFILRRVKRQNSGVHDIKHIDSFEEQLWSITKCSIGLNWLSIPIGSLIEWWLQEDLA